MFKGTFKSASTVANTNLVITPTLNTNVNTDYDANTNTININTSGYYDISVMAQVTSGTTGDLTMNILGNGNVLTEMGNKQTVATGDDYTFVSVNTIKVSPTYGSTANISIQFDTASEVVNSGLIVIERRK